MNINDCLPYVGLLTMDRLFVGSKSEAMYPVLHASDGREFRLHCKGVAKSDVELFSVYSGKTVKVVGIADNLRGHWRIVMEGENPSSIVQVLPSESSQIDSAKG